MACKCIVTVNPMQPLVVDVEHTPLADRDFKINDTVTEFNLLELHCWSHEKSIDQVDEVYIWESNLPKYVFPQTFQCPEVVILINLSFVITEMQAQRLKIIYRSLNLVKKFCGIMIL